MRDLKLALSLIAKDNGSKALRQALTGIQQQTTANKKAEDEAARSREQSAQSGIRAARSLQQEYQRSASARSTLGIRSEREIQREIAQTQAAYNRLLRTGTMTANEQTRAFRAMTQQVSQLRTELNGAGQSMSRMERARNWGSNASAIAGGVVAAGAIVAPSVSNQMNYEYRLADMTNTAFPEDDLAGKRKAMASMDTLIRRSVAVGGGNKESAAETLNTLLASGQVDYNFAEKLLPTLQKYSTATGADPKELAEIAIRLKQNFGITAEQIPTALNMAIKSGQLGSFELKDLAKWLPNQLAAAGTLGMKGLGDLGILLGLNQTAMSSAGNPNEAGNNVVNLLQKINSQDAANAAARIKIKGHGIDLPGTLARARGNGMNALEAFDGVVDQIVENNSKYKELEKKLRATPKESERREIMESQAKILEGSAIGQIIADRQALMALVAWRGNRQYSADVIKGVNRQQELPQSQQAGEQNFELISGTNLYKVNQLNNTRDFAQMDAVQPLSDILAKVSGELTEYAGAYPGLTKAMASAELAIKAMTAAAWVFAGMKFLSKGGVVSPSQAPVPAGAGAAAAGSGFWGGLTKLFGAGMSATAIATFTTRDEDDEITNGPAKWAALRARYSQDRIDRARKLYQPWYQFGQGYASENETWLAQLDKDEVAGTVPAERDAWWASPASISVPPSANGYAIPPYMQNTPAAPPVIPPINATIKLEVDGRTLAETVNEINGQSATRGPQGGPN
ncbi:phage tail tape measure protein [Yersinia frederiksenii]|nr:phage tail tape measure protein [Yersinia frederiksenii]